MTYTPVVIIGAPRSGTNMLRDLICSMPEYGTWPCDEINYIWRHGNSRYPSDAFPEELATPEVERYIRGQFDWLARKYDLGQVVEKTCANSLRVNFVSNVLPDAKYLFIVRDGRDAIASATHRWKAELDLRYILAKARFVPPTDLLYYGLRYFGSRVHRILSKERRLSFWGPKLDKQDELIEQYDLVELCGIQWRECVNLASEAFQGLPGDRWKAIKYEEFVTNPEAGLRDICDFLQTDFPANNWKQIVSGVSVQSIGKGAKALGDEKLALLEPLIQETLQTHGY